MNNRRKEALASIGIEVEKYYVDGWPPVWGIALRVNDRDVAVVESHGCHTSSDAHRNKYTLRRQRATARVTDCPDTNEANVTLDSDIAIYRTQREAVAAFVRRRRSF